jgi:hypothetical protein
VKEKIFVPGSLQAIRQAPKKMVISMQKQRDGSMTTEEQTGHRRRPGRQRAGLFIPAGLFIGLGIGLILGNPGVGVLIGLGAGFVASALSGYYLGGPEEETAEEAPGHVPMAASRWIMVLIGIFIILIGVGLIYAPLAIWPYVIAGFLVLLGIWFIVRGLGRG